MLDIQDDKALIISKYILTVNQYDKLEAKFGVVWKDSEIRKWLNEDFLKEAFTKDEQKAILLSDIPNLDNDATGADAGADTKDKVFFLSMDEANQYFKDDEDRVAWIKMNQDDIDFTMHIWKTERKADQNMLNNLEKKLNEDYLNGSRQSWWSWWLRSPGYERDMAAIVDISGRVITDGDYVYYDNGVRPALYINLKF